MQRKQREEEKTDGWLNTYADMVTLVLTFFVLLFTMSSVQEDKFKELIKVFQDRMGTATQIVYQNDENGGEFSPGSTSEKPFTADGEGMIEETTGLPATFDQLYEYLKKYVSDNNLESDVELQRNENFVYIRFNNNIFFDADSAVLRKSSKSILDYMGECFKSIEKDILAIRINGHTASVPNVENYKVNDRILSSDRANNVAIYFEEQKMIDPKKLVSQGYGKNQPISDNDTPEGREKNRRVDMMILSNNFDIANSGIADTEELYNFLQGNYDISMYNDPLAPADILMPSEAEEAPADNVPDESSQQN
ncbi:chemotaxis protein MotB [Hydrogenoanaerobacterium saccharovorans]|uniref:Chemotaxis protein MotB n=1 Tax=Hydrogenoanaerobacterium saccharovorans TaxID=474960 RepID=A0A1H7ZVQ6_9FIRM|nr:flagellar motor protein MotB [Hydrogenoanaerobacterium saccharovorans]RPF48397.1 chemotaxis protein MotB [Hydrogenoanaerobacterium saccharovorans]SEM61589.1 chemotaxis protein MotB [Hydrogenoanaerobacterium saccharovorans]